MNFLFNPSPPYVLMLDINSCFATIEQQANPRLRGSPVVVAAYTTNNGCILAASREAKLLGIKTGMRVIDAKYIYPRLTVLPPDPAKYRFINKKLVGLLGSYTDHLVVKSIDEMALDLRGVPCLDRHVKAYRQARHFSDSQLNYESRIMNYGKNQKSIIHDSLFTIQEVTYAMQEVAKEIKQRIRMETGEWITVSIGIAPNQYLAKVGSNYQKPDGLTVIIAATIEKILGSMKLTDLCGIKEGYGNRLRGMGITTPLALYRAPAKLLARAFRSKVGYDWWARLHGWGTSAHAWDSWSAAQDEVKTIGHSHALAIAYDTRDTRLHQILCQLVEKMARRMRASQFATQGIHVSCLYADHTHWGHGVRQAIPLCAGSDIYKEAKNILSEAPVRPVRILAVTSYFLRANLYAQQSLFADSQKKERVTQAIDAIEKRWGDFTLFPGRMLGMEQKVLDRIAFGGGKALQREARIENYES